MTDTALTPKLTRFDRQVLAALDPWPEDGLERRVQGTLPWKSAWAVAEAVHVDDVALVRRTLMGLTHLGYADARGWGFQQKWLRREGV